MQSPRFVRVFWRQYGFVAPLILTNTNVVVLAIDCVTSSDAGEYHGFIIHYLFARPQVN